MSQFKIYQGEHGLRAENAQIKAELVRLRADNARLRELVGEPAEQAVALQSDAFANQTSSGAKIGTIEAVAPAQPRIAVVSVMGQPNPAAGAGTFENADGCKVTIGAAPASVPQMNPAVAAARAKRPGAPVAPVDIPMPTEALKSAESGVDEDEAVQRFSQMELRR